MKPVTITFLIAGLLFLWLGFLRVNFVKAIDPCTPPITNPIVCENSKPGNPSSEWDVGRFDGSDAIVGFADNFRAKAGDTVNFKVKTDARSYKIDIYRIGYYGGMGARKVGTASPSASLPQTQPDCLTDNNYRLYDCGNWRVSASWKVPTNAVSGLYIGKLERTDGTAGKNHIYFLVRNLNSHAEVLFQTSDSTWQAYNSYGGASLYVNTNPGLFNNEDRPAWKVSYNRPFNNRHLAPTNAPFWAEYPMIRFLEGNGYNMDYFSSIDTDENGSLIKNHKAFLSVGHDEYWSGKQRQTVEAARDAGVNLGFFSGNEVFWKTRWENSYASPSATYKTLVTFKETSDDNGKLDPALNTWTGTWRDPRNSPPDDGGKPENALTGTMSTVNDSYDKMDIPYPYTKMRLWRNTSIATASAGQVMTIPYGILGFEWDEDLDNGFRPSGLIRYSKTTSNLPLILQDFGSNYGPGIATHSATLYKAFSGAKVFSAGDISWSWGLDKVHDPMQWDPPIQLTEADPRIQQATINILADLGVQPATLMPGLVPASASTDNQAPVSTISSVATNSAFLTGTPINISGTATDSAGVVGGVEVSTDNGSSWHPANGFENWQYTFTPYATGSATIKARAVDDSGNLQATPSAVTISISQNPNPVPTPTPTPITPLTPTLRQQVTRLFNSQGQYFWTINLDEVNILTQGNYTNDGRAYFAYSPYLYQPRNTVPVFRLRNDTTGVRFWTISEAEVLLLSDGEHGYHNEGIAFFVYSPYNPQPPNTIPVVRLYNQQTGQRFWTTSSNEAINLMAGGFLNEGAAFYVPAN